MCFRTIYQTVEKNWKLNLTKPVSPSPNCTQTDFAYRQSQATPPPPTLPKKKGLFWAKKNPSLNTGNLQIYRKQTTAVS